MSGDEAGHVGRDPALAAAVAATTFATFVFGSVNIGRSFNYDEGFTYARFINGGSVWRALTTQVVFNNHQMFSVTQAIAWRIGLVSEAAQRLGPVLCGAATVGLLTWWIGRRFGALAGAAAGMLLLLNPIYLNEFRLLRGYSLATLAVLVAAIATEASWRDPRRRWHVVAGAAMTTAVTTHAYSAVALAMLAVVTIALGKLRREHVVTWAAATAITVLIQLPLLDDARANSEARGSRYSPRFVEFLFEYSLGQRSIVIVIMGALALTGWATIARRSARHAAALGGATATFALVVVLLWQVIRPFDLYIRFFVALVPYLAALAAVGASRIPRLLGFVAVAVAGAALVPGAIDTLEHQPTLRDAAAVVNAAREAGLEVCGAHTEPLEVYTAPLRLVDPARNLGDCEVFIAVLSIGPEGREVVDARFEARTPFGGGVVIYSPDSFEPVVASYTNR